MTLRRVAITLAVLVVLTAAYVVLHAGLAGSTARVDMVLDAIRALGASGWIGLVALQVVVAMSGVLPASLMGVAAGVLYGLTIGFALAAASTFLGAILAFWLSRSLFRPWIARMVSRRPQMRGFDAALERGGWKLVCLLRVSPIMPFAATSYALGLSSVSSRGYALGTLAALPALFGYVMLGSFARAGLATSERDAARVHWTLLGVSAMATIALTIYVSRVAARGRRLDS